VHFDHAIGKFAPHSGLDEHVAVAGSDEERIQSGSDEVALIRNETLRPHDFRHDAKEGAAIDRISPVGEDRKFEIAKEGLHSEISNYWEHGDCSFIYLEKIVMPSEARNLLFAGDATPPARANGSTKTPEGFTESR